MANLTVSTANYKLQCGPETQDYDRAIQNYDQAIKLNPNYAKTFNNRGGAYVDKRQYERALADYEGTMLFVSHDRRFLAQLSNRVLELTANGPAPYGGGYLEYVAASGHEAPGLR